MKKNILIIILLVASVGLVFSIGFLMAEDNVFVYNDNGRRDPFWPLVSPSGAILVYDESVEFSDMTLEGIIYDPNGERLAIVNSKIVKPLDNVGGFLVSSIQEESVTLQKDGKEFILKLKKE